MGGQEDKQEETNHYRDLLIACRTLRKARIPNTSSFPFTEFQNFLKVVASFDREPCQHPREWRVYFPTDESCGYCGVSLPPTPRS